MPSKSGGWKEYAVKKCLLMVFVAGFLAVLGGAQAAQAATACFDWDCTAGGGYCTFDASCSSATPYIWKYEFSDWGDGSAGTGLCLSGSPNHTHDYGSTGPAYPTVTLKIYFFDEPSVKTVSCDIVTRNVVSPPLAMSGRCSAS
jgi:hypothetical protein